MDFYIAITCIVLTIILGIRLSLYNLKILRETRQERLIARRAFKKAYNERLRIFYGIPKRTNSKD